jgi:hypothetical protein
MQERVEAEIALLKERFPELEIRLDLWCRFPEYRLPAGIWNVDVVELAFRIPAQLPGEQPYGIWVKPSLTLKGGGMPGNYTPDVSIALGEGWGQFSWAPETWAPSPTIDTITQGTNLVNFVESFAVRLREGA